MGGRPRLADNTRFAGVVPDLPRLNGVPFREMLFHRVGVVSTSLRYACTKPVEGLGTNGCRRLSRSSRGSEAMSRDAAIPLAMDPSSLRKDER